MSNYNLYLGLRDKDTKQYHIGLMEAYKVAENILLSHVDGATIYEGNDFFKHENGTVVQEKSLIITLFGTDDSTVRKIVDDLKRAFNQESVALEIVNSVVNFW